MPLVCKQGDTNSAGGPVVGATIASVTVEGKPIAVIGSILGADGLCPLLPPVHCAPVIIQGSGTVTAEGIPIAFVGCGNNCGHQMASGSSTVEVGG